MYLPSKTHNQHFHFPNVVSISITSARLFFLLSERSNFKCWGGTTSHHLVQNIDSSISISINNSTRSPGAFAGWFEAFRVFAFHISAQNDDDDDGSKKCYICCALHRTIKQAIKSYFDIQGNAVCWRVRLCVLMVCSFVLLFMVQSY